MVRLITQAMISITEAIRILFFDKDERTTGSNCCIKGIGVIFLAVKGSSNFEKEKTQFN